LNLRGGFGLRPTRLLGAAAATPVAGGDFAHDHIARLLQQRARRELALQLAERGVDERGLLLRGVAALGDAASGLVRVAASTVVAQYLLLPSLAGLHQRHPQLRVDLDVSDRLVDLVHDDIDIAIRTATTLADTLVARKIGSLGRSLYAAPAYLASAGTPAHPGELCRHRLITNTAAPQLNLWPFIVAGEPLGIAAEGFWRANDTGLAASMVLQGLGIGRLATVVAEPLVRQGQLVPVLAAFVDTQPVLVYAVTATARQRLPKIRACIEHWAEWFGREHLG
jgi:DNA-binding transcriptional LysR family regulator